MQIFDVIFAAAAGAVWGSFCNMLIHRIPRGESISGRSRCPSCAAQLTTIDLIPLLSYIGLSGRCRHCSVRISPRYFLVELATVALFIGTYLHVSPDPVAGLIYVAYGTSAILIAAIDFDHTIIPNVVVLPSLGVAALSAALRLDPYGPSPTQAIAGAVMGAGLFLLLLLATRGAGMGMGDVKLGAFMGTALGPLPLVPAILLGSISALVFAGVVMLLFRRELGSIDGVKIDLESEEPEITQRILGMTIINGRPAVPFGPFLSLGFLLTLFWGEQILDWWLG